MFKLQAMSLSGLEKICRFASGTWVRRMPGGRKFYHLLREIPWLCSWKAVTQIEGSKMYLNPWEKSCMRQTFRGYLRSPKEPLTAGLFKQAVRPGDVVVDIGANIGFFSLLAARLVGDKGRVYSFEPEPTNFAFLCKNIALNGYENVTAFQKVVSDRAGRTKLYLANETGAHTLREAHDSEYFTQEKGGDFIDVESIVLDEFFTGTNDRVDVVKMDVEGAEMLVFSGMDRIIGRNKKIKIFTEFCPAFMREMGNAPEELARRILEVYGFMVLVVDELRSVTNLCTEVDTVGELMNIAEGENKIVNLFLERR
jgi:FkbM family methyltransferase